MKLTLIFLFFLFPVIALSQKSIYFEEIKVDSVQYNLDTILIVGMGSSATRLFLDELSRLLMQELSSLKVKSTYDYLGKNTQEGKKMLDSIEKSPAKAILAFFPKDQGSLHTNTYRDWNQFTVNGTSFVSRSVNSYLKYEQDFIVYLYLTEQGNRIIWTASLLIETDPGRLGAVKKIRNRIISSFKRNKYIQ